jgi:hypothetical protein
VRSQLGSRGTSDEELLLRLFAGGEAVEAMYRDPAPLTMWKPGSTWVNMLEGLAAESKYAEVTVQKGNSRLYARRRRT